MNNKYRQQPVLESDETNNFNLFLDGIPMLRVVCSQACAIWHMEHMSWCLPEFRWLYNPETIDRAPKAPVSEDIFDDFAFSD